MGYSNTTEILKNIVRRDYILRNVRDDSGALTVTNLEMNGDFLRRSSQILWFS